MGVIVGHGYGSVTGMDVTTLFPSSHGSSIFENFSRESRALPVAEKIATAKELRTGIHSRKKGTRNTN
jgi:hypothetical protein